MLTVSALSDKHRELLAAVHTLNANRVTAKVGSELISFAPRGLFMVSFSWSRVVSPDGTTLMTKFDACKCCLASQFAVAQYTESAWPDWIELEVTE